MMKLYRKTVIFSAVLVGVFMHVSVANSQDVVVTCVLNNGAVSPCYEDTTNVNETTWVLLNDKTPLNVGCLVVYPVNNWNGRYLTTTYQDLTTTDYGDGKVRCSTYTLDLN